MSGVNRQRPSTYQSAAGGGLLRGSVGWAGFVRADGTGSSQAHRMLCKGPSLPYPFCLCGTIILGQASAQTIHGQLLHWDEDKSPDSFRWHLFLRVAASCALRPIQMQL